MLSNQETFLVCAHICVGVCVKERDREGMCVLADRRVCALVFEKGFPVSGIHCGFLGTPHMETPLSQPTIGINSPFSHSLSLPLSISLYFSVQFAIDKSFPLSFFMRLSHMLLPHCLITYSPVFAFTIIYKTGEHSVFREGMRWFRL